MVKLICEVYSVIQNRRLPKRGGGRGLQSGSEAVLSSIFGWQGHGGFGGSILHPGVWIRPRVKYPNPGYGIHNFSSAHSFQTSMVFRQNQGLYAPELLSTQLANWENSWEHTDFTLRKNSIVHLVTCIPRSTQGRGSSFSNRQSMNSLLMFSHILPSHGPADIRVACERSTSFVSNSLSIGRTTFWVNTISDIVTTKYIDEIRVWGKNSNIVQNLFVNFYPKNANYSK